MKTSVIACIATLALLISGCSSDEKKDEPTKGTPTPTATSPVSPLTGLDLESVPANPVFMVKVANTPAGRGQTGLSKADLVVQALAEGGDTRLAALYYTQLPTQIGFIRSVRTTDVDIAKPVEATVVGSGGAGIPRQALSDAGLTLVCEDCRDRGFSLKPGARRPYATLANLQAIAEGRTAPAKINPYFHFSDKAKPAGRPVTNVTVRFSRQMATTWAFANGTWTRTNGFATPGDDFASQNLVVLLAPTHFVGYHDSAGNPVPETNLEGSGSGLLVQGGVATDVTWEKSGSGGTLVFKDAKGKEIKLQPGKTWIALAPVGDGSFEAK